MASFSRSLNPVTFADVLVTRLVARRVRVGVELHVGRDGVARDEAAEGADLREKSHLVDLSHHGVQNFTLERPEHDGFVLDWVDHESFSRSKLELLDTEIK